MNRNLRAAIWTVAVVSIAIALYYPVTQYLEGKAIDDEMLKLRRMKADAVSVAPEAEPIPFQTDEYAVSEGTNGGFTDRGLETSGVVTDDIRKDADPDDAHGGLSGLPEKPNTASADRMLEIDETTGGTTDRMPVLDQTDSDPTDRTTVPDKTADGPTDRTTVPGETANILTDRTTVLDETANGLTDRMAETGETITDRKTDLNEVALNSPGETGMKDEDTENAVGRDVEADEATEATNGNVTASEAETSSNTDRGTNALGDTSNGMPGHSGGADMELGATRTNGSVARDSINSAEKQNGVGDAVSSEPGSADNAAIAEESAVGGMPSPVVESTPSPSPVPEPEPTPFAFDESKILPEYKALYEENRDLVGWLKIDGTMVDYPVLRRADEEYYLTRDFYGNANANGQLILDAQCDPFTPDVNLVISGHDMKSGKMFGTLQRYASERFGERHPIIEFDTLFWRGRYRLVAAFQTSDYLKREDGFRYNVDIRYRLELINYLEELDRIKLYDTGVAVEFGDQLITLSTCSTQTDDGRFVVVARRLREGEQP